MKTEVYIYNLNGNRAAVRDYAKTIAEMSAASSNAYVMAFDADDEISWTIQADDDLDEVKASINWQGVRRVEIYDHSFDGSYKVEHVYVTSQKSLNRYTSERNASEFVVVDNTTQYTADNWQKAEADESDSQSDDNSDDNSDTPTNPAAEPSRLAQVAAKVAANVEVYAAKAAQRVAFLVSLLAALALALGVIFGTVWIIGNVCDALSISAAARFLVSLFALFVPAMELAVNIECNFLAVIARLFPGYFAYPVPFEVFSFWGRMLRA